jgi:pantoate--beta-alanine ligase
LKVFREKKDLSDYLNHLRTPDLAIGFVPTMGALHAGHVSLLKIAGAHSDIVVCSIFVNPTQFNNPGDLEKYPRPIEEDIKILKKNKCDVLFLPDVHEMYTGNEEWHINLGELGNILEAKYRPGHYQGVTQIVKKLLDVVKPDLMFLGQKDFQQYLVIRKMIRVKRLPVKLIMCPIMRDNDGLAMSSRNIHLSGMQRKQALILSQVLNLTKKNFKKKPIQDLKADGFALLNKSEGIKPDYFEICNARDLRALNSKRAKNIIVLIAAYVGNIRLIDNLFLK